jgi:energy-converting hydrogenase Eha subunit B
MNPVVWMITASTGSALAAAFVVPSAAAEIVLGMVAPLLAVVGTGLVAAQTFHTNPAQLLPVMLKALLAKAVFFVTYVIAMLKGLELQAEPFVISFVVYFVALYGVQAALLERLFGRVWRGAR